MIIHVIHGAFQPYLGAVLHEYKSLKKVHAGSKIKYMHLRFNENKCRRSHYKGSSGGANIGRLFVTTHTLLLTSLKSKNDLIDRRWQIGRRYGVV